MTIFVASSLTVKAILHWGARFLEILFLLYNKTGNKLLLSWSGLYYRLYFDVINLFCTAPSGHIFSCYVLDVKIL